MKPPVEMTMKKTNMTMQKQPVEDEDIPLKMAIFQPVRSHDSFFGGVTGIQYGIATKEGSTLALPLEYDSPTQSI